MNNQEPVPGQTTSQWVDTWKIMFANDPLDDTNLTPAEVDLVLGGEAAYVPLQYSFSFTCQILRLLYELECGEKK